MVSVEEIRRYVEDYFSRHPFIVPPKHVLVVLDRIVYQEPRRRLLFSGLQPSWRPDTIIVSWPLMRRDTLLHETLHTYGLGEVGAWTLAPILSALRQSIPPLLRRRVRYSVCTGGPACPYRELHRRLGSKLVHLVRASP